MRFPCDGSASSQRFAFQRRRGKSPRGFAADLSGGRLTSNAGISLPGPAGRRSRLFERMGGSGTAHDPRCVMNSHAALPEQRIPSLALADEDPIVHDILRMDPVRGRFRFVWKRAGRAARYWRRCAGWNGWRFRPRVWRPARIGRWRLILVNLARCRSTCS